MQHGAVGLVADGGQHLALAPGRRRAEDGQCLVAVAGHHHLVEVLAALGMAEAQAECDRG